MDKRSLVLYLSGLAATGVVIGLAASCSDQPRIKCTAGHGPFAVVYTHVSGDNGCAPGMEGNAGGEQVGVEAYNYPLPDNSNLDPNKGSLGMQGLDLADRMSHHAEDTSRKPYSLGDWETSEPGSDEFCNVKPMTVGEQQLAYVPAELDAGVVVHPAVQAENIKYTWKNVRFYNTPASPGTQLIAELEYTKVVATVDGGPADRPCTETVKAIGLWPVAHCEDETDGTKIDETRCSPFPDNSKARPLGSGISPDIAYRCDPILKLCVLAKDPPSFK